MQLAHEHRTFVAPGLGADMCAMDAFAPAPWNIWNFEWFWTSGWLEIPTHTIYLQLLQHSSFFTVGWPPTTTVFWVAQGVGIYLNTWSTPESRPWFFLWDVDKPYTLWFDIEFPSTDGPRHPDLQANFPHCRCFGCFFSAEGVFLKWVLHETPKWSKWLNILYISLGWI